MSDVGAVPEQEMCEHCSSYDGGYPCCSCGALNAEGQRDPEMLRRAADIIDGLEADRPDPPEVSGPQPDPLTARKAYATLKATFDRLADE